MWLAYLYLPSDDGSFECACKAFWLACDAIYERIRLPEKAFEILEQQRSINKPKQRISNQSQVLS